MMYRRLLIILIEIISITNMTLIIIACSDNIAVHKKPFSVPFDPNYHHCLPLLSTIHHLIINILP